MKRTSAARLTVTFLVLFSLVVVIAKARGSGLGIFAGTEVSASEEGFDVGAIATPTASPSCNAATVSYTGPAVAIPDNFSSGVNINLPVSCGGSVSDLNFGFDRSGSCGATP